MLLYHRVVEDSLYSAIPPPECIFSISQSAFAGQIEFLARTGYRALSLDEFARVISGKNAALYRAVLITFDDGCESVYRLAAPVLSRHRMPAVVFVTMDETAGIFLQPNSQRRMTEDEMRALERQAIACESHGWSHCGLEDLEEASLRHELAASRQRLSSIVGREVSALAVPLNSFDGRVLRAARACGYRLVFTANPGFNRPGDDLLALKRILVDGSAPLRQFELVLSGHGLLMRRALGWTKRVPPRLLGYRRWMPLRRRLFSSPLAPLLTPTGLRRMMLGIALLAALGLGAGLTLALLRLLRVQ